MLAGAGHGRAQPSFLPQNNLSNAAANAFPGTGNANAFPPEAAAVGAGAAAGIGPLDPTVILARERQILMERQLIGERLAAQNTAAAFGGGGGPGCAFNPTPLNRQQEEFLLMRRELQLRRDLQALQQHRLRMQGLRLQEQHQQARAAAAAAQQAAVEGGFSPPQRGGAMQTPGAVLSGGNDESTSPLKLNDAKGGSAQPGLGDDSPPVAAAVASAPATAPHSPSKIQQLLEIANQVEVAKPDGAAGPESGIVGGSTGPSISPSPFLPSVVGGTPPPSEGAGKAGDASSPGGGKYGSPPGGTASQRAKKRARTFAMKLMDALVHRKNDEAVAWLPDGKSFVIIDSFKFMREVYPHSFKECKYESFVRKLNQWGFTRLTSGTGVDCFSHKFFQRDRIDLVMEMRCLDWRVRRRDARANSGAEGK